MLNCQHHISWVREVAGGLHQCGLCFQVVTKKDVSPKLEELPEEFQRRWDAYEATRAPAAAPAEAAPPAKAPPPQPQAAQPRPGADGASAAPPPIDTTTPPAPRMPRPPPPVRPPVPLAAPWDPHPGSGR